MLTFSENYQHVAAPSCSFHKNKCAVLDAGFFFWLSIQVLRNKKTNYIHTTEFAYVRHSQYKCFKHTPGVHFSSFRLYVRHIKTRKPSRCENTLNVTGIDILHHLMLGTAKYCGSSLLWLPKWEVLTTVYLHQIMVVLWSFWGTSIQKAKVC